MINEYKKQTDLFKFKVLQGQISVFKYENLPEGLDKMRLEGKLLLYGQVAIIKFGSIYKALRFQTLNYNEYKEPTRILITEYKSNLNGREYSLPNKYISIVRNNVLRLPLLFGLDKYVQRLEEVDEELYDNMLKTQTKILSTTNNDYEKYDNLDNVIKSRDIVMNNLNVVDKIQKQPTLLQLQDKTNELKEYRTLLYNIILQMLGYDTNEIVKGERLITGETEVQNQLNKNIRLHDIEIRQNDFKYVNENFGLNIKVGKSDDNL